MCTVGPVYVASRDSDFVCVSQDLAGRAITNFCYSSGVIGTSHG